MGWRDFHDYFPLDGLLDGAGKVLARVFGVCLAPIDEGNSNGGAGFTGTSSGTSGSAAASAIADGNSGRSSSAGMAAANATNSSVISVAGAGALHASSAGAPAASTAAGAASSRDGWVAGWTSRSPRCLLKRFYLTSLDGRLLGVLLLDLHDGGADYPFTALLTAGEFGREASLAADGSGSSRDGDGRESAAAAAGASSPSHAEAVRAAAHPEAPEAPASPARPAPAAQLPVAVIRARNPVVDEESGRLGDPFFIR